MDPTTSALIACAGLAAGLLALLATFLVTRSTRRRAQDQPAVPMSSTGPVRPAGVVRRPVEVEVVDAVLVDEAPSTLPARAVGEASGARPGVMAVLAREALVKGVSLAHGLRHGLSGATRHRIRHEMKLERQRSRRERKDEVKVAVREYRARQRARIAGDAASGENVA